MFRITVKSLKGSVLTFNNVSNFTIENGLCIFEDSKTAQTKRFAVPNVEIEEVI